MDLSVAKARDDYVPSLFCGPTKESCDGDGLPWPPKDQPYVDKHVISHACFSVIQCRILGPPVSLWCSNMIFNRQVASRRRGEPFANFCRAETAKSLGVRRNTPWSAPSCLLVLGGVHILSGYGKWTYRQTVRKSRMAASSVTKFFRRSPKGTMDHVIWSVHR